MAIGFLDTGFHSRWYMPGPEGKVVGINRKKLMVQVCNVVDETQVLEGVQMRHRGRKDLQ